MSVEIIGQQGYDYQYLVSAFLAIQVLDIPKVKVYIEKEGGEDAEIHVDRNGIEKIIEIQVKSTRNDIGLKELVSWLQHFSDGQSDNNLLSRLIQNENESIVFVTRGRCSDNIRSFISRDPFNSHNSSPLNRSGVKEYLEILNELYDENARNLSKLKQGRVQFCQQQKREIEQNIPAFSDVLKRVIVIETQDEEILENRIFSLLNRKYFVPQNQTDFVMRELVDAVREARNDRTDVAPQLVSILEKQSAHRIFDYDVDIERPEKAQLVQTLKEQNVLLLTGISFCGKTHLAKSIACEYQKLGYFCKEESDILAAIRFLSDESTEERLCIIEDPFGHFDHIDSMTEVWARLTDFIARIKPHRKLIVTSKRDLITLYHKTELLEYCSIQGIPWIDLTVRDKSLTLALWEKYACIKNILPKIKERVSQYIQDEQEFHLLQPGQIRYLALKIPDDANNISKEEMTSLAIINAESIGRHFNSQNNDFRKLILILGIGATTISPIHENEIAHIWDNEDDFPSVKWFNEDVITDLGLEEATEQFPSYIREYKLSSSISDILDDLYTRGYISIQDCKVKFVHPTFLEAAKYVPYHLSRRSEFEWLYKFLQSSIASLNSKIALNATKQLKLIYKSYEHRSDVSNKVLQCALQVLSSIFPSVRDEALSFLITVFEKLDKKDQKDIIQQLKVKPVDDLDLRWHEGEPWILQKRAYSLGEMTRAWLQQSRFEKEELEELKNSFLKSEQHKGITVEEAWGLIKYYDKYNIEGPELLHRMLLFDEVFIRSEAAYLLMKHFANQKEYIEFVFYDPHPYVIYQGIRGALTGWCNFSEENRMILIEHIKRVFGNPNVSVVAHRFMLDFGDEYGNDNLGLSKMEIADKKKVWEVWAKLFPVFLNSIPTITFKESDLHNTMKTAIRYVQIADYLGLVESWLDWIDRSLEKYLLGEYGMAVAEVLLTATKGNPSIREHITARMLRHSDTHFLTITIADYIDCWDDLNSKEQELINQLLLGKRSDLRWLKAVMLTRANVPGEIQQWIVGQKDILNQSEEEIIRVFPENLLSDCLRVYHGHPQPLWWIGLHHSRNTLWKRITVKLLEMSEHDAFSIVMREWTDDFTDDNFTNNNKEETLKLWRKICSQGNERVSSLAFDMLLQCSVRKVGVKSKEFWQIFFEENEKNLGKYVPLILNTIESIESRNDNLEEVFGKDIFLNYLLPNLNTDYAALAYITSAKKLGFKEEEDAYELVYDFLKSLYQQQLPRLYLTNKIVRNLCEKSHCDSAKQLMMLVEKAIEEANYRVSEKEEGFDDHYELEGWNRTTCDL
ncbi:nSTAND3 domain-containing NTPase [Bacillus mycoides]|uniref:nSTAND3 domain-containing NTPase n=1 Tax=Bacillus mycoides TaxID=1405 RepID=UPI00381A373E